MQNLHALDIRVTEKEAGFFIKGAYDQTFLGYGELSVEGAAELNNRYTFRGGIALGKSRDIKAFAGGQFYPVVNKIFNVKLAYLYKGLPEYDYREQTIMPLVSFDGRRAGIALGSGFRLSSFFGESLLLEPFPSFSVYFDFLKNEKLRLGISCANYDDFSSGNMGSFWLRLNCSVRLDRQWSFSNEFDLLQSGSGVLAASFYGIAGRGGVKYTW
jgi:hypothetical protein